MSLIHFFHKSSILKRVFHTLDHCLATELEDCSSILDLGCGPSSPIQFCANIKYSVGVEAFKPYLLASKKKKIHSEYLQKKIQSLSFPSNRFDAVIMIEVIEHLSEKDGLAIIKKATKWAKKKIIITSPNGFLHQHELDRNPLQKHLSGWDYKKMKRLGFYSRGLAGLKILRKENEDHSMADNLLNSIRFRPKIFWFIIASLSQIVIYYFPTQAFELFSVKNISK